MSHTKGENWMTVFRNETAESGGLERKVYVESPDLGEVVCRVFGHPKLKVQEDRARLISAAPDLLVVSHNLANTMGIDYAIGKLSVMDDNLAKGAATILKGIQRQAKEAEAKVKKE